MNTEHQFLTMFRYEATPSDRQLVRTIVNSSKFFTPAEVEVAVQLVDERLAKGPASGYRFIFAERRGQTCGYACFGPIAATQASYDLYWIVVDRLHQRQGIGQALLDEVERLIQREGGHRVYVDTSNRDEYTPTRTFYERCGYRAEAVLSDFYAPGDSKVIYVKVFCPLESPEIRRQVWTGRTSEE